MLNFPTVSFRSPVTSLDETLAATARPLPHTQGYLISALPAPPLGWLGLPRPTELFAWRCPRPVKAVVDARSTQPRSTAHPVPHIRTSVRAPDARPRERNCDSSAAGHRGGPRPN